MGKKTIYKRGKILQNKEESWMGIFLKRVKKNSYILQLDGNGTPKGIVICPTKDLSEPFNIPSNFKSIDITL